MKAERMQCTLDMNDERMNIAEPTIKWLQYHLRPNLSILRSRHKVKPDQSPVDSKNVEKTRTSIIFFLWNIIVVFYFIFFCLPGCSVSFGSAGSFFLLSSVLVGQDMAKGQRWAGVEESIILVLFLFVAVFIFFSWKETKIGLVIMLEPEYSIGACWRHHNSILMFDTFFQVALIGSQKYHATTKKKIYTAEQVFFCKERVKGTKRKRKRKKKWENCMNEAKKRNYFTLWAHVHVTRCL